MPPLKRRSVSSPGEDASSTSDARPNLPEIPESVPSWQIITPSVKPSRSKQLTVERMVSRMKHKPPVSWMSWTDTPDKPESTLIFNDITPFDPDQPVSVGYRKPLEENSSAALSGEKAQGYNPH